MKLTTLLLAALFPLAGFAATLESFDYADNAALNRVWSGFGGDNPAPTATLDGKAMKLTTSGGAGDKVIVRDFNAAPGQSISFTVKSAPTNAPGSYVYFALRQNRGSANLVLDSFPIKPGESLDITINNNGRFQWFDGFSMLICMHDAGKPMAVTVGPITAPGTTTAAKYTDTPQARQLRQNKMLSGKTVQIDTGFPMYSKRSAASIAEEVRVNGYDGVYLYSVSDSAIMGNLVEELKRRKIGVGLMTLPSLVYWSEADMAQRLPEGWRDWLIQFTGNEMDLYRFIGFVHPEYNRWYKNYLNNMLTKHRFDIFTFAEIMYPIYDGPAREKPFYGDVSPAFQAAFKRTTGNSAFPNFTDPAHPDYFKTNTELYRALVEYRVGTINDFYADIVNAPDGARAAAPETLFATWTLGINIPDGVAKLREWEGNDIAAMIRAVKPDVHFIQTHAPDWSNPELPGSYPKDYRPFFDAVRNADPEVKIGMQADFGSLGKMRRNAAWQKEYYQACREAGVATTTYYEFMLRDAIYADAPRLVEVRQNADGVRLIFDQRLGEASVQQMRQRPLTGQRAYQVLEVRLDGNLLDLKLDALPAVGETLQLSIGGIVDDPELRYPSTELPPGPRGPVNRIPDGTTASLPVLPPLS